MQVIQVLPWLLLRELKHSVTASQHPASPCKLSGFCSNSIPQLSVQRLKKSLMLVYTSQDELFVWHFGIQNHLDSHTASAHNQRCVWVFFLLQAHIWHFGKCAYLVSCQESVKVTDASLLSVGLWWRVISQTNAVFGQVTTSLTKHWLNPKIKSSLCELNHHTLKWRHIWPIDHESGSTGDFILLNRSFSFPLSALAFMGSFSLGNSCTMGTFFMAQPEVQPKA